MKRYGVIANDDAMKYQVVSTTEEQKGTVLYENDGAYEAEEILELMNHAYEEGKKEALG